MNMHFDQALNLVLLPEPENPVLSELDITSMIQAFIGSCLGINPSLVPVDQAFKELDIDASIYLNLLIELGQAVGGETLPITFLWHYPTIETLAHALASDCAGPDMRLAAGG